MTTTKVTNEKTAAGRALKRHPANSVVRALPTWSRQGLTARCPTQELLQICLC